MLLFKYVYGEQRGFAVTTNIAFQDDSVLWSHKFTWWLFEDSSESHWEDMLEDVDNKLISFCLQLQG